MCEDSYERFQVEGGRCMLETEKASRKELTPSVVAVIVDEDNDYDDNDDDDDQLLIKTEVASY